MNSVKNRIFMFAYLLGAVSFMFTACEEDVTDTTGTCNIGITAFSLSSTSLSPGDEITGSVTFTENLNLDVTTLRSITGLYLSDNGSFDANDTQLTAFTSAPSVVGNSVSVDFDQIDIPFGLESGEYFVIAYIAPRPCPDGGTTSASSRTVSISVN